MHRMWIEPRGMMKSAGPGTDAASGMLNLIPHTAPVFGPMTLAGDIAGLFGRDPTIEDIRGMNKHPGMAFLIPGLGSYRNLKRRRLLHKLVSKKNKHTAQGLILSELASPALQAGLGTALGARVGGGAGALAGFGTMAGANLISALSAAFTKRRSLKDQGRYEDDAHAILKNLLIPGRGVYNAYKGLGATRHLK